MDKLDTALQAITDGDTKKAATLLSEISDADGFEVRDKVLTTYVQKHLDPLFWKNHLKNHYEAFSVLVQNGEFELAKIFKQWWANLGIYPDCEHPILTATWQRKWQIVEYLLNEFPIAIKCKCNKGLTILHYAAWTGSVECMEVINKHPDVAQIVNEKDIIGYTALHYATSIGHLTCIKYLIEKMHIDPNITTSSGKTALDLIVYQKHMDEIIIYLAPLTVVQSEMTKHLVAIKQESLKKTVDLFDM